MNYRYIFNPIAFIEYKDAVTWYAERSETATINFVKEVKEKIAVICKEPLQYRNTYKKFRETSLNKYPYSIVYIVEENNRTVIILSLYHHKRNPQKKYRG